VKSKSNSFRKIFWFILFFSFVIIGPIWSENNSDSKQADSLEIASIIDSTQADSLEIITIIDSSFVEIDSTFVEELIEEEPVDTFYIDIQKLKEQVDSLISKRKEIEKYELLPHFIYNENFHLKSVFEPDIWLRKNGFLILPFTTSRTHLLHNFAPLFQTDFSQNQVSFYQTNYNLPVAMTEAILGLGDLDMNHAFVRFQKGNVFNIRNLNVKADYFGQDGYWYSVYEKSSNFNLHLFYDHKFGKFHYYHTTIDQEIPSDKLLENPSTSSMILEKSFDNAFLWENKILNAGIQLENYEVNKMERKQTHFLLNKTLIFQQHKIQSSIEYFIQSEPKDNSFSIFSINNYSNISSINIGNTIIYQDDDNFLISSEIDRKIYKFLSLIGKYSKIKNEKFLERKGIGLNISPSLADCNLLIGEQRIAEIRIIYAEAATAFIFKFNNLNINLKKWTLYQKPDENLKNYPELQSKVFLDLVYNLKYNNAIKFGLSYFYNSDYRNDLNIPMKNNANLDGYLAFKITDRFEIKVDAINLLNSTEFIGEEIPERHYNFGVNWVFVN